MFAIFYLVLICSIQVSTQSPAETLKLKRDMEYLKPHGPFAEEVATKDCPDGDDNGGGGGRGGGGGGGGATCSSAKSLGQGSSKQKASHIAQEAAKEAKAANDAQMAAGEAAAQEVRQQLAEKAIQAARAAEAALAGKQQIVEQLEQEVREAEAVVQEEEASLQQAQAHVESAVAAASDANSEMEILKKALQVAESNVLNSETTASGAQNALQEKHQVLDAARIRVESLMKQLGDAKADYDKTKQAAYKAVCAAAEAKSKAQRTRRKAGTQPFVNDIRYRIKMDLLRHLKAEKNHLQKLREERLKRLAKKN